MPTETGETTAQEQPPDDLEVLVSLDLHLSEIVNLFESVDWRDVPGVSPAEAAAFHSRLIEAREQARERADDDE